MNEPRARTDARRRWLVRAAILASIALSGVALVSMVLMYLGTLSQPPPTVLGLRLGASADQVRAARPGGEWTTSVAESGDLALARDDERYELHEGLLVALDVLLPPGQPDALGSARVVTPTAVLVREPAAGRIRVRMISRTCPTHAAEAERLAGEDEP